MGGVVMLDLDDARRIIANLTSLKIWFEGIDGKSGALDKIDHVKEELDELIKRLDNLPEYYLKDFKSLLNDTTESALIIQSDLFINEIDSIIKNYSDKLPAQVARLILKSLNKNTSLINEKKGLLEELNNKELKLRAAEEKNVFFLEKYISNKKRARFLIILSSFLVVSNSFLCLVVVSFFYAS